jgi:hypothetical protein|tara:strand:- start:200 stop:637 length:438 start_codon:yes stop_codon:yes gene_type:complete
MNWEKLKKNHYYTEPVEHIHTAQVFDTQEYDKLYENQKDLNHKVWNKFKNQYKVDFKFNEQLTDLDLDPDVIVIWAFRDRSHRWTAPQINVGGKKIAYTGNAFIVTKCKDIRIEAVKRKHLWTPFVQITMSNDQYNSIVNRFNGK